MRLLHVLLIVLAMGAPPVMAEQWEHLFDRPTYQSAKISPDGKYIAVAVFADGKRSLAFIERASMSMIGSAKLPDKNEVGEYFWVNKERVVIEINQREPWQEQPLFYGELFAVNYDGSNPELIYGYRNHEQSLGSRFKKKESVDGWAEVVDRLEQDDRHIMIKSTPWDSQGDRMPGLYRLNVYNGKLKKLVIGSPVPYAHYVTNSQGEVKVVTGINKKYQREVYFRENDKWRQITLENYSKEFLPLTLDKSEENLFIIDNFAQDKSGLFKLNLTTGKLKRVITDKNVDISQVKYTSDRQNIYALRVDDGLPSYYLINKDSIEANVFKGLISAFPGQAIDITSKTDDGDVFIVKVASDIEAGTFYVYDIGKNKLQPLFKYFPKVNSNPLVYTVPFEFTSSDGLKITGYYTPAKQVDTGKPAPVVVMVHGGPHARDYWEYNADVQFLALNGYSVLQVNFRGSEGFGHQFESAGYENWGSLIQQDIYEALQWAIKEGKADKNRACIMGASFGGYSAVQSAIKYPSAYQCAIAYAGVYDLELFAEEGNIQKLGFGKSYIDLTLGKDINVRREMSPVHHVSQLNTPLMLAHGEQDEQVPYEHAKRLRASLEQANKPYEWHSFNKESHGFFDPENRKEYMRHVLAFLEKHI